MKIAALPYTLDVARLRDEIAHHPKVWDEFRWRTNHPRSPHRECSDIWCRYNALSNFGPRFNDEHESVWYPVVETLTEVPRLCDEILAHKPNYVLAGVLITKVPSGKCVYPHIDLGWHAENTEKIAVLVEGNAEQSFCFDDIAHRSEVGECFTFNNQARHWVENPSDIDRITLIACVRRVH